MSKNKSCMLVRFKMDKQMNTDEWRERFSGSYEIMSSLKGIFFKNWWINQEEKEWGAYYIFNSREELEEYINSDLWKKKVPEKYGCVPEVTIFEPGPIISKEAVDDPQSWYDRRK